MVAVVLNVRVHSLPSEASWPPSPPGTALAPGSRSFAFCRVGTGALLTSLLWQVDEPKSCCRFSLPFFFLIKNNLVCGLITFPLLLHVAHYYFYHILSVLDTCGVKEKRSEYSNSSFHRLFGFSVFILT